ncbi:MAG: glycosyltransferase family 4 protein [Ferruginibacter sp.]
MKILFLTHKFYPDIGGIEVNSEILANAFQEAGHEICLVTWTKDQGTKTFPFTIIRNPGLSNLIKAHRWADIVFENNPSLRLAWPSFILNKKFVVALRTWINRMDGTLGWQDKLKLKWLKKASAVIAVSEAVRLECWLPAIVIGNPYRNELFKVLPGVEKNGGFVFLGRLVSDKGVEMALKAFAVVLQQKRADRYNGIKMNFTIIGDGPELPALTNLVNKLGIQDDVEFKGALRGETLVNCLNQHRFILVPSLWAEPFGNVALEGMACGCVPIVSDGGGLVDAIGNAGLSFKRGDVASLADCIRHVIEYPAVEQQLRENAPAHLSTHLPEKVSERYLSVLENCL